MKNNFPSHQLLLQCMELLAYAVLDLYPTALLVKGQTSNIDFFYDFVFEIPLTDQSIPLIEERWRKAIKEFQGFEVREMMRENAASLLKHLGQSLKAEEILSQTSNIVSLIHLDHFNDLVQKEIEVFSERIFPKLFSYFTYREQDLLVTRIEGTAFDDQSSLKAYQKKRKQGVSHLQLGKELCLFSFDEEDYCFNHRGERLRKSIAEIILKEAEKAGFQEISFSGEMPKNLCENIALWGEDSCKGDINQGLIETSVFHTLELWTFDTEKSHYENCISSLQFIQKIIKIFDLNHEWVLRDYRPVEVSKKKWQAQVDLLKSTAEQCYIQYCSDQSPDSFSLENSYPKIEVAVYDAFGRRWAVSAIRFANCGNKEVLVVSPLLSLERLVALLLEQTSGNVPNWLQPEQARILLVAKEFKEVAKAMQQTLSESNIRAGIDASSEKLVDKIRFGIQQRVPYLLVVGEEEEKKGLIAVRRFGEEQVLKIRLEDFIQTAKQELKRKLES